VVWWSLGERLENLRSDLLVRLKMPTQVIFSTEEARLISPVRETLRERLENSGTAKLWTIPEHCNMKYGLGIRPVAFIW
jgi:hypothetical protein